MSNPATLLADLLETWTVPKGSTALEHRGGTSYGTLEFWREQARAVDLARQVDELLDAAERMGIAVTHLTESRPAWYAGVFAALSQWDVRTQAAHPAVGRDDLRFLRVAAVVLQQAGLVAEIPADDLGAMRAAVDDLEVVIRDHSVLDAPSKLAMLELTAELRRCIDEYELVGVVSVREAAQRTLAVVIACAGESSEKERGRLKRIFDAIVGGAFGGAGAHGLIELASSAVENWPQITGGG